MPGWHVKTETLVKEGKLAVLGLTQEQHPARTRLFMQWQEMKWPVLLDSLNLLGCKGIPFTLLIDEHGVVRDNNPKGDDLSTFLATNYPKPVGEKEQTIFPSKDSAEGMLIWLEDSQISSAIEKLKGQLGEDPKDGKPHFRLGVAYRMRYDSAHQQDGDFENAVSSWKEALRIDPAQYIWRRRIQQYGPRLNKPYSFYDWVHQARLDITARNEEPFPLVVEPSGAEFALPENAAETKALAEHPDPDHQVPEDTDQLISVESVVVPSTKSDKPAYRIHLTFTPSAERRVHWTNDAGPLAYHPEETSAYTVAHLETSELPGSLDSNEKRYVEFEVRGELPSTITGSAYYYVCEDVNGQCLFLRKPVSIKLN